MPMRSPQEASCQTFRWPRDQKLQVHLSLDALSALGWTVGPRLWCWHLGKDPNCLQWSCWPAQPTSDSWDKDKQENLHEPSRHVWNFCILHNIKSSSWYESRKPVWCIDFGKRSHCRVGVGFAPNAFLSGVYGFIHAIRASLPRLKHLEHPVVLLALPIIHCQHPSPKLCSPNTSELENTTQHQIPKKSSKVWRA